jgi:membrane protein
MTGEARPRRDVLGRASRFFSERIWDARPAELARGRRILYRLARLAYMTVRGYFDHRLPVRAAALTYFSVLSVVPFLAFAFALLKGFGAYRTLVEGTIRPYLDATFGPNPALHQAALRILGFVDATDFSRIGALGLALLVYTSVTLVSSVEEALNDVFGAKATRPILRQLTDYVTLLVTTPLLVLVATTASTAAQSSAVVVFLRQRLGLGPVIDFALGLAPVAVVGVALFAMYLILPNVRTRATSAAVGALLAAVGWQTVLVLHVQLQMGVARANAIYSVLGSVPIFLVWVYLSWLIVLVGAELAASHQNEQAVRQRLRGKDADQALRELIAVALGAEVARGFLDPGPPPTAAELAAALEIQPAVALDVLDALVRAGVLIRALADHERVGYVPGRDLDVARASDLRDAVRRDPGADDVRNSVERRLGPELRGVLLEAERERRRSPTDLTLRQLAALARPLERAPETAPRPRGPGEASRAPVLDAKQPDPRG